MNIWSDTEYVYRCLADEQRTLAFKMAVESAVKPGSVVLDVGTGSGIMATFAAAAGARRVYAVEVGKYLSKVSREIFLAGKFSDVIVPLQIEASQLDISMIEKPDVVICEQVTTGLIGEPQAPVIHALKDAGVIDAKTVIIPAVISTSIALVQADYEFYGHEMKFPIFVDYFSKAFDRRFRRLSEECPALSIKFSNAFSEFVDVDRTLASTTDGSANGLLLISYTNFTDVEEQLGTCISYCQPVILPIIDLEVSVGTSVKVSLKYEMGGGFDSLEYAVDVVGSASR